MPTIALLMEDLRTAEKLDDVFQTVAQFLIKRDIVRISYHHLPPLGAPDRDRSVGVAAWNFPQQWVDRYANEGFWRVDPIPRVAIDLARPFWWSEVSILTTLRKSERDYMVALRRAHLGDGLAIPVFGPRGRDGYVGLGCPPARHIFTATEISRFQLACQLGHQRYCQLLIGDGIAPRLSERETEVLHWMAMGKSNSVIADIEGLSSHTIDTYVRRLYSKLDVSDRISAVLRGAALGLVT